MIWKLEIHRPNKNAKPYVYLRVMTRRKSLRIWADETNWDQEQQNVMTNHPEFDYYFLYFKKLKIKINNLLIQYPNTSIPELFDRIFNRNEDIALSIYLDRRIAQLHQEHRHGNARAYEYLLGRLQAYLGTKYPYFQLKSIVYHFVVDFSDWMIAQELSKNTRRNVLSTLRALYNHAVTREVIPRHDKNPFEKLIKPAKTAKKAQPIEVIKQLRELDLKEGQRMWHYRNYFLFSLNAQGMNFADVAMLKPNDILTNPFYYTRLKLRGTGDKIEVWKTPEMQSIIDMYYDKNNSFLFPILKEPINANERSYQMYKNKMREYGRVLKSLASKLGIDNLTSYTPRHTYGSLADQKGIDRRLIQKRFGHTSFATTQIYLDDLTFDNEADLNERILE